MRYLKRLKNELQALTEKLTVKGPLPEYVSNRTLVEVVGNQVKVGTPLSCPCPMSIIEVQAITQLLSGRIPRLLGAPVDTIEIVEDQCPRRWDTYDLTWP